MQHTQKDSQQDKVFYAPSVRQSKLRENSERHKSDLRETKARKMKIGRSRQTRTGRTNERTNGHRDSLSSLTEPKKKQNKKLDT